MDASCVSEYIAKIKLLLENALKPNFCVNLNVLLSHFTSNENKEVVDALLNLDLFTEWIIQACTFWEENEDVQPTTNLGCFILEMATLVSKNEERFQQLSSANAYLRLCDTFRFRKSNCAVQIKMAYVKLLESFLEHKGGVEWIRATNTWIDVLNYCLAVNSTNDLAKASGNFLYKLLECRICFDEAFCNTVVKRIMQPLMMNSLLNQNNSNHMEIDEQQLKTKITPTLQLIIALLQQYLNNECISHRYKHLPKVFFVNHKLLPIIDIYKLLIISDEEVNCELANIIYLVNFITLCIDSKQHMITEEESIPVLEKVFYLMEEAMTKKHCTNVAKLCQHAINYWSLIHKRLLPMTHKDINKDPLLFQVQIAIMQAMSICQFFEDYFKFDWSIDDIDEMRDFYVQKCCRRMNEYTFRLMYTYREAMLSCMHINYKIVTKHISYIQESMKYHENEAGVIIFQLLVYALHDVVHIAKADPVEFEIASKEDDFFLLTIGTIMDLIDNFDLKWTNCMESLCAVNTVLDFLLLMTWPTRLTVEALKLLKLSIEKYMSPNLALLVDRTNDSSLRQLGPLLLSKLQDSEWEIRDGALQVLITISELSHSKFLSFQDLLQQEKFPCLVLELCERDPESLVRGSALKCLQHMVQSTVLWNEFFKEQQQQLLEQTTKILNNEREDVNRLEAAVLIHRLYSHQQFDEEGTTTQIYKIMASAATVDLHWAVKTTSLEFWNEVIWNHLHDQGMIDGNFPEVIFSKERKKIIKLDEDEIKRRLGVVLDQLNTSGCLQVLINAIEDDPDIEVVEAAVEVTKKFVELLKKYKVLQWQQCAARHESFFSMIQQDLDKVLQNRKKWLTTTDTFGTVLSDMLKELEQDEDMNVMECY